MENQLPNSAAYGRSVITPIGGTNYFYWLGGMGNGSSTVYKAQIGATGDVAAWGSIGQFPNNIVRQNHAVVTATIGGTAYIYVLGGYDGSNYKSTVYRAKICPSGTATNIDSNDANATVYPGSAC